MDSGAGTEAGARAKGSHESGTKEEGGKGGKPPAWESLALSATSSEKEGSWGGARSIRVRGSSFSRKKKTSLLDNHQCALRASGENHFCIWNSGKRIMVGDLQSRMGRIQVQESLTPLG